MTCCGGWHVFADLMPDMSPALPLLCLFSCCRQVAKEESMMERMHLDEARRKALLQQLDLQTQTVARAHLKAAEVDDRVHAAQLAKDSEARYLERVEDAQQKVAPKSYFGRKKVEWFH
jgi:hypothetical protein